MRMDEMVILAYGIGFTFLLIALWNWIMEN